MEFRNDPGDQNRHIVTVENVGEHLQLVADAIPIRGFFGAAWLVYKLQKDFAATEEYPHNVSVTARQFHRVSRNALRRQIESKF